MKIKSCSFMDRLAVIMMVIILMSGMSDSAPVFAAAEEKNQENQTNAAGGGDKDKRKQINLGIDNAHIYEGMKEAYGDGYVPLEDGENLLVVVPFTSDGELKEGKLTVSLDFGKGKKLPFQIKNYNKDIKGQNYTFEQDEVKTYLYSVKIPLNGSREGGQYPIKVKAEGLDEDGNKASLEYTIFATVSAKGEGQSDGDSDSKEDNSKNQGGEGEEGSGGATGGDLSGEDFNSSGGESGGAGETTEEVVHQPKFLMETCSFDDVSLEAGSEQNMEISFQNRSKKFAAYNLKITIQQEGDFLNFNRTSEYFEKVEAGGTITLKEGLRVQEDAKQGSVPVQFLFEYEDDKGNVYSGTETYQIRVHQPVKTSFSGGLIPAGVYAADTISTDVQIVNLGRAPIYNIRVSLKGTGLFAAQPFYGGELEAGSSAQGNVNIYVGTRDMESIGDVSDGEEADKYGDVNGTLVLEYEDSYGKTYSQSIDYATKIQAPKVLSLKAETKEETNQWWISIIVLLGLGLSAGVAIQTMRIYSIKKKL